MLTMSVVQDSNEAGRLHLNAHAFRAAGRIGASVIDISAYLTPEREKVEAFIRDIYGKAYHADIGIHYPTLMSVRTESGQILAATGFRYAVEEPLFLEQYLGQPVEQRLTRQYGQTIPRTAIVEIGNLASSGGGASVYLFAALSAYLYTRGIRYATITGTHTLRDRLQKLGLGPQELCAADPLLLPEAERECWGSYYEQRPQVLSGSVAEGMHHLRHALGILYEEQTVPPMVPRLHYRKSE